MKKKKDIIGFNHISKDLSETERDRLTELYKFYHKLANCYRWKHSRLRGKLLLLTMTGVGLTSIGVVVGGLTLNPILIGVLAGQGVLLETYVMKSGVSKRMERCRFAYTNYKRILTQIRNFLRGAPMDDRVFLSDLKVIDDIVTDTCPCIEKLYSKYNKRYNTDP